MALIEKLTAIADAVRSKTGKIDGLTLDEMPGEIEGIQTGGGGEISDIETQWLATIERSGEQITMLPNGVKKIGAYAFSSCTNLALTSLPDGITSINMCAFQNCTNFALTSLPDSITTIGNQAFQNCKNIAITSIPSSIRSIGYNTFSGCEKLTELTFKGKPTVSIHGGAFNGCTNITTINVPWAEGEVANAPWGATNATINYNYTGG